MVRITKISAGTLLLILSIVLMIKSGFENFIAALVGTGAIGGAAGILLAITYIIAAAIYILTNRTYSVVPDVVSFVILILGGLMGLFNSNLPDTKFLVIWSWLGIVIGAIVLIISITDLIMHPVPDEDDDQQDEYYDQQNQNGYPQQQFNGQPNQYPQSNNMQQPMQGMNMNQGMNPNQFGQAQYPSQPNNQYNPNQPNGYQNQYQQPASQNNQYGYRNSQPNNQMNGMDQGQNPYARSNQMPAQQQNQFNPRMNRQNPANMQQGFPQQSQQTSYPVPSNNGQFGRNNQFNNNQINNNNQANRSNQFGNSPQNNQMNNQAGNGQFTAPQQGFGQQQNPNQAPTNGPYGFQNFDPNQSRSRR